MNFLTLPLRHRQVVFVVGFVALALGLNSLLTMPRQATPTISVFQAVVAVHHHGDAVADEDRIDELRDEVDAVGGQLARAGDAEVDRQRPAVSGIDRRQNNAQDKNGNQNLQKRKATRTVIMGGRSVRHGSHLTRFVENKLVSAAPGQHLIKYGYFNFFEFGYLGIRHLDRPGVLGVVGRKITF